MPTLFPDTETNSKFALGIVIWPDIPDHLMTLTDEVETADGDWATREGLLSWLEGRLAQHHRGDWGDVGQTTGEANDRALTHGGRLVSRYSYDPFGSDADRNYTEIITEANRLVTRIILVGDLPEALLRL